MKEINISPELVGREREKLEENNPDVTDTEIIQLLIQSFGVNGSRVVANYLNWYARQLTNDEREPRS